MLRNWILLMFSLLALPAPADPPPWDLSRVRLTCASGDCPAGAGALVLVSFATKPVTVARCSATLISSDRVFTTAHCSRDFAHDAGYFFLARGGRTEVYSLASNVMEVFDYSSSTAHDIGAGEDVAIWQLTRPVPGHSWVEVSRQIPPDMSHLVAYTVENPDADFMNLQLTPKFCSTQPHLLFSEYFGGSEDDKIGLKLFGCNILFGDGGAAVFVVGHLDKMEAMITSRQINMEGGYANRVQCLAHLPGLAEPSVVCPRGTPVSSF